MLVEASMGQLRGADEDASTWFFVAGPNFSGDMSEAYGGSLTFTLGHSEYNSLGLGLQDDYDIILDSALLGISLGHKHVVPGWVTSSQSVVELSEEGGWVRVDSGESATKLLLLRVLSSLSALRIRGSYYHGHEFTFLTECILTKGNKTSAPWIRNDTDIDELCYQLKLSSFACEQYGLHIISTIKKLDLDALKQQFQEPDSSASSAERQQQILQQSSEKLVYRMLALLAFFALFSIPLLDVASQQSRPMNSPPWKRRQSPTNAEIQQAAMPDDHTIQSADGNSVQTNDEAAPSTQARKLRDTQQNKINIISVRNVKDMAKIRAPTKAAVPHATKLVETATTRRESATNMSIVFKENGKRAEKEEEEEEDIPCEMTRQAERWEEFDPNKDVAGKKSGSVFISDCSQYSDRLNDLFPLRDSDSELQFQSPWAVDVCFKYRGEDCWEETMMGSDDTCQGSSQAEAADMEDIADIEMETLDDGQVRLKRKTSMPKLGVSNMLQLGLAHGLMTPVAANTKTFPKLIPPSLWGNAFQSIVEDNRQETSSFALLALGSSMSSDFSSLVSVLGHTYPKATCVYAAATSEQAAEYGNYIRDFKRHGVVSAGNGLKLDIKTVERWGSIPVAIKYLLIQDLPSIRADYLPHEFEKYLGNLMVLAETIFVATPQQDLRMGKLLSHWGGMEPLISASLSTAAGTNAYPVIRQIGQVVRIDIRGNFSRTIDKMQVGDIAGCKGAYEMKYTEQIVTTWSPAKQNRRVSKNEDNDNNDDTKDNAVPSSTTATTTTTPISKAAINNLNVQITKHQVWTLHYNVSRANTVKSWSITPSGFPVKFLMTLGLSSDDKRRMFRGMLDVTADNSKSKGHNHNYFWFEAGIVTSTPFVDVFTNILPKTANNVAASRITNRLVKNTQNTNKITKKMSQVNALIDAITDAEEALPKRKLLEIPSKKYTSSCFDHQWVATKKLLGSNKQSAFAVLVIGHDVALLALKIAASYKLSTVVLLEEYWENVQSAEKTAFAMEADNFVVAKAIYNTTTASILSKIPELPRFVIIGHTFWEQMSCSTASEWKTFAMQTFSLAANVLLFGPSSPHLALTADIINGISFSDKIDGVLADVLQQMQETQGTEATIKRIGKVIGCENDKQIWKIQLESLTRKVAGPNNQPATLTYDKPFLHVTFENSTNMKGIGNGLFSLGYLLSLELASSHRADLFRSYLQLGIEPHMHPNLIFVITRDRLVHSNNVLQSRKSRQVIEGKRQLATIQEIERALGRHYLQANFSFMTFDGFGNKIAAMYPEATVITVEPVATQAIKEYVKSEKQGILNHVMCSDQLQVVAQKFYESPEMLRYSYLGSFLKLQNQLQPTGKLSPTLGFMMSSTVTSFITAPSARLLSLVFTTFFNNTRNANFQTSAHPLPQYAHADMDLIRENAEVPHSTETQIQVVHDAFGESLVRIDLVNMTRVAHHHFDYTRDGHQRTYRMQYQQQQQQKEAIALDKYIGGQVSLVREEDGHVIPFMEVRAITLICLLRMGLVSMQRNRFYDEFLKMPLYEDMAPWNIVFIGNHLDYIDQDTRDVLFTHSVRRAYQVLSVLMNYRRTVDDFGRCPSNGRNAYNFPFISDCVGRSNPGPCRESSRPVPCGDGSCQPTFIDCLQVLWEEEQKRDKQERQEEEATMTTSTSATSTKPLVWKMLHKDPPANKGKYDRWGGEGLINK